MKFDLPAKLNGVTLRKELAAIGVILPNERSAIVVSENELFLDVAEKDYEKVVEALKNHNGEDTFVELTIEQKLESVGLNVDELKAALGL